MRFPGGGYEKGRVFIEKGGFLGVYGKNGGFGGKMEVLRDFNGKIGVLLKTGVFVGFWSRNRGK